MNLCIIDDDLMFQAHFEKLIRNVILERSINVATRIIKYKEVPALQALKEMDIIFVDVNLQGGNCVNVISEYSQSITAPIVFMSSNNDCVFETLRVHPFFFLRKNMLSEDFGLMIDLYEQELFHKQELKIYVDREEIIVNTNKIICITACGHDITIKTMNTSYRITSSLKRLNKQLNQQDFVRIEKSSVINVQNIRNIIEDKVIMKDGTSLKISKFYRQGFEKQYTNYLLGNHA